MKHTRASGFSLVELLVGLGLFMLIMFLTLAAWDKARHAVERSTAIMNLHYEAYQTALAFEDKIVNTTPCAPMYVTRKPERILYGNSTSGEDRMYNVNAFMSEGWGYGKRFKEENVNQQGYIDEAKESTSPFSTESTIVDGKKHSWTSMWGWHRFAPVYKDPSDGEYKPIPLVDNGDNIKDAGEGEVDPSWVHYGEEGYRVQDDPRGYPYNTYNSALWQPYDPSIPAEYDIINDSSSLKDKKVVTTTEAGFTYWLGGSVFMMQWANRWPWTRKSNRFWSIGTYKYNWRNENLPKINQEYETWRRDDTGTPLPLRKGIDLRPTTLSSNVDDMAFIYRALNGETKVLFEKKGADHKYINVGKKVTLAASINDVDWSKKYGEVVQDGEGQLLVTAPTMELGIRHRVFDTFKDGPVYQEDDNTEYSMTTSGASAGSLDYGQHPFEMDKQLAKTSDDVKGLTYFYESTPMPGFCLMTNKFKSNGDRLVTDAQINLIPGSPAILSGYFSEPSSPLGGTPLSQPQWIRFTFELLDKSEIPLLNTESRAKITFDHWVMLR